MDKRTLIMLAVTALIFGGVGMGASSVLHKKDGAASTKSRHGAEKSDGPKSMITLDDFVVNLADADPQRYLKVTVALEVNGADMGEGIKTATPQIRDAVISTICTEHYRELLTASGKLALKRSILKKVNAILGEGEVTSVYFTAFAMQ